MQVVLRQLKWRIRQTFGCLVLLLLTYPTFDGQIYAEEMTDIAFRSGFVLGTISYQDSTGLDQSPTFGGIPFEILWNRGLSKSWSLRLSGNVLLDVLNMQIIRQGYGAGVAYHFLGGPRSYGVQGPTAGFTTNSSSALSVISYSEMQNYAATDAKNPSASVAGGTLEFSLGLEYRRDISDLSGVSVEFKNSLYSLPTTATRIKTVMTEVIIGWCKFI